MEIEHIWADHYERHTDEFSQKEDFRVKRNTIGDLLLLPKSFNASYGDSTYEIKVKEYVKQNNVLAKTLNKVFYEHHPRLKDFIYKSSLNIEAYDYFKKSEIDKRSQLYRNILVRVFEKNKDYI